MNTIYLILIPASLGLLMTLALGAEHTGMTAGEAAAAATTRHSDENGHTEHHHDEEKKEAEHEEHAHEEHVDTQHGKQEMHEEAGHKEHDHEKHADTQHTGHEALEEDGHEEHEVHLSAQQQQTLGIETQILAPRRLGETINAPGEVRLNAYATSQVTPRIAAQVIERHARLGEAVAKDQALLTLSSVEMAQAQGELVMADREWQRVRKLGKKVVSDKRYLQARIARQQARSRVIAFGMLASQADALLRGGVNGANGAFQLLAPQAGTVIRDDFILGELVEPGRVLFEITDEHLRWIQARMSPQEARRVSVDDAARVRYGDSWLDGRVIQIHHVLDESTRTQAIRIEVPDAEHRLHPGVFVDVAVLSGQGQAVLALPEAAVLRNADGDWQVFMASDEPGAFVPREVKLVRTAGGLAVIRGLPAGTQVVTRGAFFLQSELAKAGFDIHNH